MVINTLFSIPDYYLACVWMCESRHIVTDNSVFLRGFAKGQVSWMSLSLSMLASVGVFFFSFSVSFPFHIWIFPAQCMQWLASIKGCNFPVFRATSCARELLVIASPITYPPHYKILKGSFITDDLDAHGKKPEHGRKGSYLCDCLYHSHLI